MLIGECVVILVFDYVQTNCKLIQFLDVTGKLLESLYSKKMLNVLTNGVKLFWFC